MWESIKRIPRGRLSTRSYIGFVPALLVASFLYILFVTPTVHAADATRKDDTIVYDGKTYKPATVDDKAGGLGLKKGDAYYVNLNVEDFFDNNNAKVSVLTFPADSKPKTANQAEFRTGKYDSHDNRFTGLSPPKTITIGTATDSNHDSNGKPRSSCDLSGVGWIICPLTGWIADGVDFAYSILSKFFIFSPLTTSGNTNSIYNLWGYVRNIANICFIIAFLIVIYSQMTSGMMSNYAVKKILPRIIVAAILVNTSYWICAIGVDISNILGISIQDFLTNLRGGLGAANTQDFPTWSDVTTNILAGSGLVLGTGAVLVATGGTVGGLIFLLLGALIPAIFSVLVAVAILAARQALITVFIVIAPLAFVAYLLPNTEEWFNRWRKLFMTMLIMFPAFSLIFGASQLVGIIIIQNATDITVALLGMTVQVVPLFITPFLIKLSSGLLGTIAGLANDKSKGVFDRTKNWANNNRELHRQRGFSTQRQTGGRRFRPTNVARALNNRTMKREGELEAHKAVTKARFADTSSGRDIHKRLSDAKLYQGSADASNQEAWTQGVRASNYRRGAFEETHMATGRSKILEENMTNHADARLQRQVKEDYSGLRTISQDSHTSAETAKAYKEVVESASQAHWDQHATNDPTIRELKLEQHVSTKQSEYAKAQWDAEIKEWASGNRPSTPYAPGSSMFKLISETQGLERIVATEGMRMKQAERAVQVDLATALKDSQSLLTVAGGVMGEQGRNSVLASAKTTVTQAYLEDIKNIENTADYGLQTSIPDLKTAFNTATTMTQRIAYTNLMAKNGPDGALEVGELIRNFEATRPSKDDLKEFKELLGQNGQIRDHSKSYNDYINNAKGLDTPFDVVHNSVKTWNNLAADKFAKMSSTLQKHAINVLSDPKNGDPDGLAALSASIRVNIPARSQVKPAILRSLGIDPDE